MGTNCSSNLDQSRLRAALESGGTSDTIIYTAVLSIVSDLGAEGSVLDFGAGTGALTKRLNKSGRFAEVAAIDLLPRPRLPESIVWMSADLNNRQDVWRSRFDVVVSAEVTEHLENLRETFRSISHFLRPNGIAVVTTPNCGNFRSYLSLTFKRQFYAFTDSSYPAHITPLLESDIKRCAQEAGFEEIQIDYRVGGRLPKFTSLTWQHFSLRGRLFSDCMIAVCRKQLSQAAATHNQPR